MMKKRTAYELDQEDLEEVMKNMTGNPMSVSGPESLPFS